MPPMLDDSFRITLPSRLKQDICATRNPFGIVPPRDGVHSSKPDVRGDHNEHREPFGDQGIRILSARSRGWLGWIRIPCPRQTQGSGPHPRMRAAVGSGSCY